MANTYNYALGKDVKIFIGGIPAAITEEKLRWELSKFGGLTSTFYMPDLNQGSSGWAFATYTDRDDGAAAVEAIDGKLYFEGLEEPCKAQVVTTRNPPDSLKATCSTHSGPVMAAGYWQQFTNADGIPYYYNMRTGQTQWRRPLEMEHQVPVARPVVGNTLFGPPGSNLFVFHLPAEWDDADFVLNFQQFGTVLSARVQRDSAGRNKGFGFISYDNPLSALNAIKSMNGFNVAGKYLKVQLKKGEEHCVYPNTGGGPSICGGRSESIRSNTSAGKQYRRQLQRDNRGKAEHTPTK
ncbi:RNA binding motif containing protein, putative [Babesia bigemina]|uniref:RNA binding motif containing protein, putative n=1 Tax=Babesia bigemina TaxID=5866 RepID=A0A061DEQ2_BABBI|nr:RNA binding motif containing protein, putative [Babesia bigemina]CDR97675.1 RNA binding motif containing protein, putative [Babesia bigemina]|eukprot:XP_012769861.1 RNA binding motif containing protein, putative [Babesia bigemina]